MTDHGHGRDHTPGGGVWLLLDVIVVATVAGLVALGIEWLIRQQRAQRAGNHYPGGVMVLDTMPGGQVRPDPGRADESAPMDVSQADS